MIVCDTHVHLFGPLSRYPADARPPYVVPDATPGQLLDLMDANGVTRAVVVHAATSGRDNRRTLDACASTPVACAAWPVEAVDATRTIRPWTPPRSPPPP